MNEQLNSSRQAEDRSQTASFVLLRTEKLPDLAAISNDEIASALRSLADSSPVDFTIDNAIALCDELINRLGAPKQENTTARRPSQLKAETEADAYDDYFSIMRADGDNRRIFARSMLLAFRNLLVDAKSGCTLTPVEWGLIRQGFVELALLITAEYRYRKE